MGPRLYVWLPHLRQPQQLYVDHGYPMPGIFDHAWLHALQLGYLDLDTNGYHLHELLAGFLSSRSIRTTPTLRLQGDVSPLAPAFGFFSNLTVCGAPAMTAGEY